MPYPNQPADVSDQAFRVATNICMMMDRQRGVGLTLGDIIRIARYLDNEYGAFPDNNLLNRIAKVQEDISTLRAAAEAQLAAMNPEKTRSDA